MDKKVTAKFVALLLGIPAALFILLMIFAPGPEPITERVARECKREYGSRGDEAVDQCRVNTLTRYLLEHEREKARSVYDRIR